LPSRPGVSEGVGLAEGWGEALASRAGVEIVVGDALAEAGATGLLFGGHKTTASSTTAKAVTNTTGPLPDLGPLAVRLRVAGRGPGTGRGSWPQLALESVAIPPRGGSSMSGGGPNGVRLGSGGLMTSPGRDLFALASGPRQKAGRGCLGLVDRNGSGGPGFFRRPPGRVAEASCEECFPKGPRAAFRPDAWVGVEY
jgi:hypothetical protein